MLIHKGSLGDSLGRKMNQRKKAARVRNGTDRIVTTNGINISPPSCGFGRVSKGKKIQKSSAASKNKITASKQNIPRRDRFLGRARRYATIAIGVAAHIRMKATMAAAVSIDEITRISKCV
jgi:hypothetical protein